MKKILFGVVALTLLTACAKEPEPTKLVIDLAAGKAIADADCSDCHGMDGRGATSEIPNLTAQPTEYLIEALHAYRDGGRQHAALQDMTADMSEADIANIAGYYSSLPPLDHVSGMQTNEAPYIKGAAVAAICEDCHGAKGISTTVGIPSLAGQQPIYLMISTQEYKSDIRGHQDKEDMLQGLEEVDIEKMAMYFASQSAPVRNAPPFGDPVAGKVASASCGKCHGADGISHDPMVPNLAGQEPVYLVNAIKAYRDHQRSSEAQMPAKTDEQIENLAAYYSIQKVEASVEDELSGQELAAKCNRCHSPASGERKLTVPSLNGQNYDYLVKAMQEYRREERDNSMMHKMSSRYSDEMIETLATYYASQSN